MDHSNIPLYTVQKNHPFTKINSLTIPEFIGSATMTNKFVAADNPEAFKLNLKKQPDNWRYRTVEVVYNINSSGYRTYEWDKINWKEAIVIFGCSCTFGVGQAENETVSHYLELFTKRQVVNLGVPAGSNHLILQNTLSLIENFGYPYAVGILWAPSDRFRFFGKEDCYEVGSWDAPDLPHKRKTNENVELYTLWTQRYLSMSNEVAELYYLNKTIKLLYKDKTRFANLSYFEGVANITQSKYIKVDKDARDLMHPGHKNSFEAAKYLNKYF